MTATRWWKFAVLRGPGIPAHLDGMWLDVDEIDRRGRNVAEGAVVSPTTASSGEACLATSYRAMTLPAAESSDDCPPRGITRSHGLWLVSP